MRSLRKYIADTAPDAHAVIVAAVGICHDFTLDEDPDPDTWIVEMIVPSMYITIDNDISFKMQTKCIRFFESTPIMGDFYTFEPGCLSGQHAIYNANVSIYADRIDYGD